jgi:pullulanase/glycogen debranching enzyme
LKKKLDSYYSDKQLGCCVEEDGVVFRLFAPRATSVNVVIFEAHDQQEGRHYEMAKDADGVWEYRLQGQGERRFYAYKVNVAPKYAEQTAALIGDPYAKAVVTRNTYLHEAKSIIIKTDQYDWQGDTPLGYNWEDLTVYEMHVRDMTAHPSAQINAGGTYRGLTERGGKGGLQHVLDLGVNAVELLPCQEFANMEIPFGMRYGRRKNTWNPYARNHWGYMTSYFFAPESYYASQGNMEPGAYCGIDGRQVTEFKDLVKTFHQAGLAVILDVVFNHVSQYDLNPFKYIDRGYYFRLNRNGSYQSRSYCGNDLKTERPMVRRFIIDAIKYWLETYHVDGFRFDIAPLIDWETIAAITYEAQKINPKVVLIAEPWSGGGRELPGFSERGWASWNDLFRNSIKGDDPESGVGWLFGKYRGKDDAEAIRRCLLACTTQHQGPFRAVSHAVNYLESHDDYTLGDFIRIATGKVGIGQPVSDPTENVTLCAEEMAIHKLAATCLLTSQGMVMISEGQEFARSKVIAKTDSPESAIGCIDRDSYAKDDETNWLNFDHKEINRELNEFYQALIVLRHKYPAFRRTPVNAVQFLPTATAYAVGYVLPHTAHSGENDIVVLMNANRTVPAEFSLPVERWRQLSDGQRINADGLDSISASRITLQPCSSMILLR